MISSRPEPSKCAAGQQTASHGDQAAHRAGGLARQGGPFSAIPTRGLPASEIWLYPQSAYPQTTRTLLITVSRSGETTETIRAGEAFRKNGGNKILSLTGYSTGPLATIGDLNLVLPTVQEESVAQTRAFSTLYLATVALTAMWSGRASLIDELVGLPAVCERLIEDYGPVARDVGALPTLDRNQYASASGVAKGAYVLADPPAGEPELILIATGSRKRSAPCRSLR